MSAIAQFFKLPIALIDDLEEASTPGPPGFSYLGYLRKIGKSVADFKWSGYVLVILLVYLQKKQQIDLMKSEYDELATALTNTAGATHVILTDALKTKYLAQLDALSLSETELRDYYNKFNASNEPEMGQAMLDGVKAITQALSQADDSSIVLLIVG